MLEAIVALLLYIATMVVIIFSILTIWAGAFLVLAIIFSVIKKIVDFFL